MHKKPQPQKPLTKEEMCQKLEKEIERTQCAIEDYKEMTKPISPENAIGRLSRMEAINNKTVAEAAMRQAEDKLDKLHYVLSRIHEKDFGLCGKCRKPIPLGRILIMPQSIYCVECAK